MKKNLPKLKNVQCKNCKTTFKGRFCPNCGQSTQEFDKPFKFLFVDLVGNVFAFDTRFWTSLKSLIAKPGKFTEDYLDGRRARYMPPFRLNIFISFLFFFLLSYNINHNIEITEADKQSVEMVFNNTNTDEAADELKNSEVADDKTTKEIFDVFLAMVNKPDIYINSFLKYLSWSMFLLMPVFAFLQWLYFRKSRPYFYSHLVSAINQHSLIFLLFVALLMLKIIIPNRANFPEDFLLWFLPPYVMVANKQLYKLKWSSTIFKTSMVLFMYLMVLIVAIASVFLLWIRNQMV